MECPKCFKDYDDSFAFCPHCGEITPEPTKDCPHCKKVVKAEAVKCRYCHADLTKPVKKPKKKRHPVTWLRNKVTWKKVGVGIGVACLAVGVSLGVLTIIRTHQKGHYQKGQDYLSRQEYNEAVDEFQQAGGYANAGDLARLTKKYNLALLDMEGHQWQQAYDLLKEVSKTDNGFQDVAGKLDYIKRCPQTPVYFSIEDLRSKRLVGVPIKNLLGETIDSSVFMSAWSYSNHGSPDLISTVNIGFAPAVPIHTVLAASPQAKYKSNDTDVLYVPQNGQQFDVADSKYNCHFIVTGVSIVSRPPLGDGSHGADPVFGSLNLTIEVSPK